MSRKEKEQTHAIKKIFEETGLFRKVMTHHPYCCAGFVGEFDVVGITYESKLWYGEYKSKDGTAALQKAEKQFKRFYQAFGWRAERGVYFAGDVKNDSYVRKDYDQKGLEELL